MPRPNKRGHQAIERKWRQAAKMNRWRESMALTLECQLKKEKQGTLATTFRCSHERDEWVGSRQQALKGIRDLQKRRGH